MFFIKNFSIIKIKRRKVLIRRFDGCKLSPKDDRDWTLCSTGLATQEMVDDTNYPDYFMIDIPQDIYNQGS